MGAPAGTVSSGGGTGSGTGGGKGRPTPSRRAAERERRQRVKPTLSRRDSYRRQRDAARAEREKRRQGMLTGDPRHLPRRDQGPVRAYVRDVVDSRRSIAEFFLVFALGILVASLLPVAAVRAFAFYLWSVMLLVIIVDSFVLAMRLRKALRERFPEDERKGAVAYGLMRSTQLRRLRLPPPRIKPGQPV
jgi:Protein of unknown function (DUF3043)